jgi:hypothetical protein
MAKSAAAKPSGSPKSILASLLKQWDRVEARTGGIVPDDTYEAKIVKAEYIEKNEKPKYHFEFKVLDGKYEGKSIHKWENLSTPMNLEFLKGDLQTLGVEIPEDMDDEDSLNELLGEVVDSEVEVRVRTSGEFTNVYINQVLESGGSEDAETETESEPEEDEKPAKAPKCKACKGTGKSSSGKTCAACEGSGRLIVEEEEEEEEEVVEEEEAPEIEEGSNVMYTDEDDREWHGVVKSVVGKYAKVKVGKEIRKVKLADLAIAEEE